MGGGSSRRLRVASNPGVRSGSRVPRSTRPTNPGARRFEATIRERMAEIEKQRKADREAKPSAEGDG
jgi:hypothetical protein